MLETIAVILIIFWLLGYVSSYTIGGFIHVLTGARLREIVQLDKADIDLHQSTVRLHRKGGDITLTRQD